MAAANVGIREHAPCRIRSCCRFPFGKSDDHMHDAACRGADTEIRTPDLPIRMHTWPDQAAGLTTCVSLRSRSRYLDCMDKLASQAWHIFFMHDS